MDEVQKEFRRLDWEAAPILTDATNPTDTNNPPHETTPNQPVSKEEQTTTNQTPKIDMDGVQEEFRRLNLKAAPIPTDATNLTYTNNPLHETKSNQPISKEEQTTTIQTPKIDMDEVQERIRQLASQVELRSPRKPPTDVGLPIQTKLGLIRRPLTDKERQIGETFARKLMEKEPPNTDQSGTGLAHEIKRKKRKTASSTNSSRRSEILKQAPSL